MKLQFWLSQAVTMFANGFVSGLGAGSVAGGAAATASTSGQRLLYTVGAIVLTAAANGCKRVLIWHDANPIPNPFAPDPEPQPDTPSDHFAKLPPQ
jgi:hypothetical protein